MLMEAKVGGARMGRSGGRGWRSLGSLGQVLGAVAALLALLLVGVALARQLGFSPYPQYPATQWQSVFLENGQVYFGHVVTVNRHTVRLRDIFYLRVVSQPLQASQPSSFPPLPEPPPEQQFTLIKLGNELHGPVDEMDLNRDHVLLIENLKDEAPVAQAIQKHLAEQMGSQTP